MSKERLSFPSSLLKKTFLACERSKKGDLRIGAADSAQAIEAGKKTITLAGVKGRSFIFGLMVARTLLRRHVRRLGREERGQSASLAALKAALKEHSIKKIMESQAEFHAHTLGAAIEDYNLLLNVYMLMARELVHLQDFLKRNPAVLKAPEARKFFEKFTKDTFELLQTHQKMLNDLAAEAKGHSGLNLGLRIANITSTQTGGFLDVFAEQRRLRAAVKDEQMFEKLERKGVASQEQLKTLENALNIILADINALVKQVLSDWRSQLKLVNEDDAVMQGAKEAHEIPAGFAEEERNHRALLAQLVLAYLHSLEMCVNQVAAEARKVA